jgi:hypothetical protein
LRAGRRQTGARGEQRRRRGASEEFARCHMGFPPWVRGVSN